MPAALLDTNVLVHAANANSALHAAAEALIARGLRERGKFCIAPQNLIEFCAVVTRPRFREPPVPLEEARHSASLLWRSRRLAKIYPVRGTVGRAVEEGAALGLRGSVWYDVFLAVTMRDAGVSVIVTENLADFARIPFVTAVSIREAP